MDKVVGTRLMLNIGMTLFLAADKKNITLFSNGTDTHTFNGLSSSDHF